MQIRNFLYGFLLIFLIAFIVTAAVTFFYSQLVHSKGMIDWETSIRQGIIFGIIIPVLQLRKRII